MFHALQFEASLEANFDRMAAEFTTPLLMLTGKESKYRGSNEWLQHVMEMRTIGDEICMLEQSRAAALEAELHEESGKVALESPPPPPPGAHANAKLLGEPLVELELIHEGGEAIYAEGAEAAVDALVSWLERYLPPVTGAYKPSSTGELECCGALRGGCAQS